MARKKSRKVIIAIMLLVVIGGLGAYGFVALVAPEKRY